MSKTFNFDGPYLKVKRAEHHIDNLKRIFAAHVNANKNALNPKRRGKAWIPARGIGTPIPTHTPTILGDAIHNLRAALDHAYCVLVESNGCNIMTHPNKRNINFPFTEDTSGQSREGSVQGHAKLGCTPSQPVIRHIFDVVQPYKGGHGDDLLSIHLLDIADKHMILIPIASKFKAERIEFTDGGGVSGITFISEGQSYGSTIAFGGGVGPQKGANNQASFDICFGRGQPFEFQPILPVLERLHGRTVETLKGLEVFLS